MPPGKKYEKHWDNTKKEKKVSHYKPEVALGVPAG